MEEILEEVSKLKNNKAPGIDGLTAEFYKNNKETIAPLLKELYDECIEKGKLTTTMRTAVITLLYKKDDKDLLKNYRPISLLTMEYKILTKIMSARLTECLPNNIDPQQTGFIKGRNIRENIRIMKYIFEQLEEDDTQHGYLVLLDFAKAYDRVDRKYMLDITDAFGVGCYFQRMIETIYNTPMAQVLVNGYLTRPITLKCGVRQGCPLSCALFIMCIEPLGCSIRTNKRIQGIQIKGTKKRIKATYFADDSSATITKQKQINTLRKECIGLYEEGSGAKLNDDKTVIIPMGKADSKMHIQTEMKMNPRNKVEKFLGDIIGNKIENSEIFKTPIERIKKKIQTWNAIDTTVFGREVIKNNKYTHK